MQGICNFDEFQFRMNIFTTGDAKIDLFENVIFSDKIAISGSIMTACLQKYHPLMELFTSEKKLENQLSHYYNEYYCNADIDIMVKTPCVFEYFKIVNELYNQIKINICKNNSIYAKPEHVKLILNKKCNFFVNKKFIAQLISDKDYIDEKDQEKFNIIKETINTNPIMRKIFYNIYIEHIITPNLNDANKIKYPELFDDNVEFGITIHNDICELKLSMNYKYAIRSPHLLHNLEIFQVKYDDFFSTVGKFHLPCVRAYYNGSNVYMTPSCITAHMTFMNIDYKYFAGARDPIEIINKYRMRGFGTWLSDHEVKQYNKYSANVKCWSDIYLYIRNIPTLNINNLFFKPRMFLEQYYVDVMPVDLNNRYIDHDEKKNPEIVLTTNLTEIMIKRYKIKANHLDYIIGTYINKYGYVASINKWLIPAYFECSLL